MDKGCGYLETLAATEKNKEDHESEEFETRNVLG